MRRTLDRSAARDRRPMPDHCRPRQCGADDGRRLRPSTDLAYQWPSAADICRQSPLAVHVGRRISGYLTHPAALDGPGCTPGNDRSGTDCPLTMQPLYAHWPRTVLTVVASLALCWSAPLFSQSAPDPEAEERLQAVDAALARIEDWLEDTRRQQSSEEARLSELQHDISNLVTQQSNNRQQMERLQHNLTSLDTRQQELLDETDAQRAQIAQVIRTAYLQGSDSRLKMLLNQQDPDVARRMMVYFNTLNASHLEQIRQWQRTLEALQANRDEVEQTRQDLASTNRDLEQQQQALLSIQQQRQDVIADLQRQM